MGLAYGSECDRTVILLPLLLMIEIHIPIQIQRLIPSTPIPIPIAILPNSTLHRNPRIQYRPRAATARSKDRRPINPLQNLRSRLCTGLIEQRLRMFIGVLRRDCPLRTRGGDRERWHTVVVGGRGVGISIHAFKLLFSVYINTFI